MRDNESCYKSLLDFDQYQRYKIVSLVVEYYRNLNHSNVFNILEIGSNKPKHLRSLLPKDNILFTDIVLDEEMQRDPEFQSIDGTNIPFDNSSFDFVVATDVLEHVPVEKRKKFLYEAARVSRYAAIITFPYYSKDVIMAEERLNAYYKATKGEDFIWIKQHEEFGLPKIKDIDEYLENSKYSFFSLKHGDIILWEKMYYSIFDALGDEVEWSFRQCIDQYYINNLFPGDISDSCYRTIYVLTPEENKHLKQSIEQQMGKSSPQKLMQLEFLFQAQREIHLQQRAKAAQREIKDKSVYVSHLEQRINSSEAAWRIDVQNWEKDKVKYRNEISQLQLSLSRINKALTEERQNNNKIIEQLKEKEVQNAALMEQLSEYKKSYQAISEAFCWKLTKPIRSILDFLKNS